MPASLRELRQRRTSVANTQKITKAMELIAASRIIKAQGRAKSAEPYTRELTRAVSAVAAYSNVNHPLTQEKDERQRAAVLVITSDRGQAGAYSSNVLRAADGLQEKLRNEGVEPVVFLAGRKGQSFYNFRHRDVADSWEGFSEEPHYKQAHAIAETLTDRFLRPDGDPEGVDEIHVVYTRFVSMLTQRPEIIRLLPLEVVEGDEADDLADVEAPRRDQSELLPLYSFEPDAETVLNELLPLYVANRIHYCLLQSAASELASRQRAMKSATDNAEQLIQSLTRQANQARQAGITQEISEIVGGAGALADAQADSE